jgi:hypothetical protein
VFIENLEWINWFQIQISENKTAILISLLLRDLFRLLLGWLHLVQPLLRRSHWGVLLDDFLLCLHALDHHGGLLMGTVDVVVFLLLLLNHNNFLLLLGSLCWSSSDLLLSTRLLLCHWLINYDFLYLNYMLFVVVLAWHVWWRGMGCCVHLDIVLLVIGRSLFAVFFHYLVWLGLVRVVRNILVSSSKLLLNDVVWVMLSLVMNSVIIMLSIINLDINLLALSVSRWVKLKPLLLV